MKELKESARWYKAHGYSFEEWYECGHAYGCKKREARKIWNEQ